MSKSNESQVQEFWKAAGQIHEFAEACDKVGMTPKNITDLIQQKQLEGVRKVAEGSATIVRIPPSDSIFRATEILVCPVNQKFRVAFFYVKSSFINSDLEDLGENFNEWFLPLTINPRPGYYVSCREIIKPASDGMVLDEIGERPVDPAAIFHLLCCQSAGQSGDLLNDGRSNKFYARSRDELRVIRVYRTSKTWRLHALHLGQEGLQEGDKLFYRNSFEDLKK